MRHFILLRAVAPGSRRMVATATQTQLVASASRALRAAPGHLSAILCTVDVAAITTGADQHRSAAARAEKKARGCIGLFGFVTQTWTKGATGGILPPHSCPARVWGAALMQTST
jgi:hypothetical protein